MKNTDVQKNCEYEEVRNKTNEEMSLGVRHFQVLLMFLCLTTAYCARGNMGVAIVAMTDQEASSDRGIQTFDWDKKIQGFILSSFFFGYLTMQIPGGYIAHRYGAKFLLTCVMICNGCMALLTPFAAQYYGWKLVCVCRAIQGLTQGSILPCLHCLQGKWLPMNERGRLSTYAYGGYNCGTILAMTMSGFLAASSYGWPLIFYSIGLLNIVVGIIWSFFGADSPATHRSISEREKEYIQKSLGSQNSEKHVKIPWFQILTFLPTWAIAVAHVGNCWITLLLLTQIPTYMSKVMGIDIKANGLFSSLPYVGMWAFSFVICNISDRLINKGYLKLTYARKLANTIAMWGVSCFLLILAYVPAKHVALGVSLLVLMVSIKSAIYVGFHVNHIDISPNFSGTLMSISNCFSHSFGMMAPIVIGVIVHDDRDVSQWRTVFFISAAILFSTNLFYIIFGSSKKAEWNEVDFKKGTDLPVQEKELQALNSKVTEAV